MHFDGKGAQFVYFMKRVTDGAIKIGTTHNVIKRRKSLEGATGPLFVLAVISGDRSVEADLHERFNVERLHGEWFAPSPAIIQFIEAIDHDAQVDTVYNRNDNTNLFSEAVRMSNGYRLCIGCMEDWTYSKAPFCPSCQLEHDLHAAPKGTWNGPLEVSEWWGLTEKDIRGDDAVTGDSFYIASASEGDIPYHGPSNGEEDY